MNPTRGKIHEINRKLYDLWKEGGAAIGLRRWCEFFHLTGKEDILFVGYNPSFNDTFIKKCNMDPTLFDMENGHSFETIYQLSKKLKERAREGKYQYYVPVEHILNNVRQILKREFSWSDIDLYPIRETKQKVVEKFLRKNNMFKEKLEMLFSEILENTSAKVIVVANARASKEIEQYLRKYNLKPPHPSKIYWRVTFGSRQLRFIFTSMLSGQRALDTHTREIISILLAKALT